jgi:phosphotransferase system HPr-like phosphotransfer protein
MITKDVIVRCESGLHNRQATYFVQRLMSIPAAFGWSLKTAK